MTTATVPDVVTPPPQRRTDYSWLATAVTKLGRGDVLTLTTVDWAGYQSVLAARGEWDRKVRIWYFRGSLVIMTTAALHERWKKLIGRLLETIALAQRLPLVGCGNMTVAREEVEAGLEPDECYYVQQAIAMGEYRNYDFAVDPPPDLAIEVENTRRLGGKTDIYAALGVPEVWRFNGTRLQFLRLTPDREYETVTTSLAFPWLSPDALTEFLDRAGTVDDTALCRQVFEWVETNHPRPQS